MQGGDLADGNGLPGADGLEAGAQGGGVGGKRAADEGDGEARAGRIGVKDGDVGEGGVHAVEAGARHEAGVEAHRFASFRPLSTQTFMWKGDLGRTWLELSSAMASMTYSPSGTDSVFQLNVKGAALETPTNWPSM